MVQLYPCWKEDQPASLLPSFCNVPRLQYTNFVLQARNVANEFTNLCMQNFAAGCCGTRNASE